jgi:hypothetical protein
LTNSTATAGGRGRYASPPDSLLRWHIAIDGGDADDPAQARPRETEGGIVDRLLKI